MKTPRILVKAAPGLPSARLSFGATPVTFTVAPLFKSIAPPKAPGATAATTWQILTKHNRAASVLDRAVHVLCLVRTAGEHHQFSAAIRLRSS